MLQPGGELDLSLEALGAERVSQVGVQDLECDRPVVTQILGEKDGCHAAAPQLALEGVRCGEGRLQLRAQVRQLARLARGRGKCTRPTGRLPAAVR